MPRLWLLLLSLLLGLGLSPALFSYADEEDAPLEKQTLALQRLIQKTIVRAEPSVACVTVSRSADYQRFRSEPVTEQPGRLGAYDAESVDRYLRDKGVAVEKRRRIMKRLDLADADNIPESFGSGVILDAGGLILTPYHVVRGATKIYVRWSEDHGDYANIFAADPRSDLAVLRLIKKHDNLKPIQLGDGEKVERGQFVLALSYPHAQGFQDGQRAASWGIISTVRRRVPGPSDVAAPKTIHHYGTLLQIDARIAAGCSGGGLLNLKGQLIGLTTSMAALRGHDTRGGFAVPMTAGIKRIIGVLRKGEEVEYGFLGVRTTSAKKRGGVEISYVTPGSPADIGGLKARDMIVAVNGKHLQRHDDFFLELALTLAGSTAKLEVQRHKAHVVETVSVVLAKYYTKGQAIAAYTKRPFFRGLRVDDSSLLVQQKFPHIRMERIPRGVVVTQVQPNSPAATELLKPGEVISHVDDVVVCSPREFYERVRGVRGSVQFTILNSQPGKAPAKVVLN